MNQPPIVLHRVHLAIGRLSFEIECVEGEASGDLIPAPASGVQAWQLAASGAKTVPPLAFHGDEDPLFEPLRVREQAEYLVDIAVPESSAVITEKLSSNPVWPFSYRLRRILNFDPPRRWRVDSHGRTVVTGRLKTGNNVGLLNLSCEFGEAFIEIASWKLRYTSEFRALLDQVAAQSSDLLLHFDSPVGSEFSLDDSQPRSQAAALFFLRHIMADDQLPAAVAEVTDRLHSKLVNVYDPAGGTEIPDAEDIVDGTEWMAGGPLARLFLGHSPRSLPGYDINDDVDTPENRYVKFFLEELLYRCGELSSAFAAKKNLGAARELTSWEALVADWLSHANWQRVGRLTHMPSNSQVLQRRKGYRDVLKADLQLQMGLRLDWQRGQELGEGLVGDIRPVSELYEYWCFFILRQTLLEIAGPQDDSVGKGLVRTSKDGISVTLKRGLQSSTTVVMEHPDGPLEITLYYNKPFDKNADSPEWTGSYTARFTPDFSIVVSRKTGALPVRHWLHFDAKYRLDFLHPSDLLAQTQVIEDEYSVEAAGLVEEPMKGVGASTYKTDDLYRMHTYRDGILGSRGAYILFPGDGGEGKPYALYPRQPSSSGRRVSIPSVGAFELSPLQLEQQRSALQGFLSEVFSAFASATGYQEEEGLQHLSASVTTSKPEQSAS